MDNILIPENANIQRCPRCQSRLRDLLLFMDMNNVQCVNLIFLNAAPGIHVKQIIIWILVLNGYKKNVNFKKLFFIY
jgi:hypothetical protein